MKTGIITFHRAVNYGAVLQTYALQKTLFDLEIDNEVIDYRSEAIEALYNPFRPLLHNIRTLDIYTIIKKKNAFEKFLKKNIILSEEYQKENLIKTNEKYCTFITGSDQVWCEKCANQDTAYFLDFVKESNKKNSYAASIGKQSLDDNMQKRYQELLKGYHNISIREESAEQIIYGCTDSDANVHVDPTLLLTGEKWDVVAKRPKEKQPYILMYTVLGQYHLYEFARKLAKETGMPIVYLNEKMMKRQKDFHYKVAVSPEEFVGYFANASYVVTNSFHGTAFSVLYHKKFFVEIEAVGRRNIRSEELIQKLGIGERELTEKSITNYDKEINWEEVDSKLDCERKKAWNYLQQITQ